MAVKDEIDLMIKSIDEGIVEEPEVVPDVKTESEPEPIKEEPKPEDKKEEPKPEADKKEEPEPELDEKDKTIADLRTKLAESEAKKPEPAKIKVEEPKKEEPKVEELDFVGDLDPDEIVRDPKEFNKLLNKVYQSGMIAIRGNLDKDLPNAVRSQMELINSLRETSEKFYTENEDLKPFKKVVATVFEELTAIDPNKTYDEVIKGVGPEVRKRLELPEKKESDKKEPVKEDKKSAAPKLPVKGGRAGKADDKQEADPLQAELEEMNKTLGR